MNRRGIFSILLILVCCLSISARQPASTESRHHQKSAKEIVALTGADHLNGIAKRSFHTGTTAQQQLQIIATGLQPSVDYQLWLDDRFIDNGLSDQSGAIEFSYHTHSANQTKPHKDHWPADIALVSSIKVVTVRDQQGAVLLTGSFKTASGIQSNGQFSLPNFEIAANQVVTFNIPISDPNGDIVTTSVSCDKGNFVTVDKLALMIAPKDQDVGTSNCLFTATDKFNLSSEASFAVVVSPANQPPTIAPIQDQVISVGESRMITIQVNDPNPADVNLLRVTILNGTPALRSIVNGPNPTSFILILQPLTLSDGGRATIQVTDPGGLSAQSSFNVNVTRSINITTVTRSKPALFISGSGFGAAGAQVFINGVDVTPRIIGQSDNSISLKGNNRKLNLKSGANQVQVKSGGITSNSYIINLLR